MFILDLQAEDAWRQVLLTEMFQLFVTPELAEMKPTSIGCPHRRNVLPPQNVVNEFDKRLKTIRLLCGGGMFATCCIVLLPPGHLKLLKSTIKSTCATNKSISADMFNVKMADNVSVKLVSGDASALKNSQESSAKKVTSLSPLPYFMLLLEIDFCAHLPCQNGATCVSGMTNGTTVTCGTGIMVNRLHSANLKMTTVIDVGPYATVNLMMLLMNFDCHDAAITVHDGADDSFEQLAKYCSLPSLSYISHATQRYLTVVYKSFTAISSSKSDVFKLVWSSTFVSCNNFTCEHGGHCISSSAEAHIPHCVCPSGWTGLHCDMPSELIYDISNQNVLKIPNGVLASPNYPNLYPSGQRNLLTLITSPTMVFQFKLELLMLEASFDGACYDSLSIYDGELSDLSSNLLGRFCGSYDKQNLPLFRRNVTSGPLATVLFSSDQFVQDQGFLLCFSSISCGQTFVSASSGTISSPHYPKHYPYMSNCHYTIHANRTGYKVLLTINKFDLETSPDCFADFLQIQLSENPATTIRLCGGLAGLTQRNFASDSDTIRLYFHSDTYIERTGFSVTYDIVLDTCANMSCPPHSECVLSTTGAKCQCLHGYEGESCTEIDYCLHVTCSNHGTCNKMIGGYNCSCNKGWMGKDCELGGETSISTSGSGQIASPNYAYHSVGTLTCKWRMMSVLPGKQGIVSGFQLQFNPLNISSRGNCTEESTDVVMLYDHISQTPQVQPVKK
ncbi:unnamed protein product [Soboliphyme baturini]|uniref:Deleted in malignant brain tumors 1 protein n=1 Tax=Soboliphyme baturini TaxID=241478 RepID=A0A183ICZ7_9BILA|nr:unnamed protein product [Soboliphyme baturini]